MLPRLQAQEQLLAINAAALGSGGVKKAEARPALLRLERLANGGKLNVQQATPATLRAMGIKVIEVKTQVAHG
ncbi:hypothetical protein HKM20_13320 [Pelagibacterium halotolerans]|nr:hypothetical protein HKM20_13320 [Pelagibacterium halotolerans]